METIRMPKGLFKKWIKALEGGTYKQAKNSLYNPKTGGFCCLGVLQHVQSGGSCETCGTGSTESFLGVPSSSWLAKAGIDLPHQQLLQLIKRNDGEDNLGNSFRPHSFKRIAAYLKKNVETY